MCGVRLNQILIYRVFDGHNKPSCMAFKRHLLTRRAGKCIIGVGFGNAIGQSLHF